MVSTEYQVIAQSEPNVSSNAAVEGVTNKNGVTPTLRCRPTDGVDYTKSHRSQGQKVVAVIRIRLFFMTGCTAPPRVGHPQACHSGRLSKPGCWGTHLRGRHCLGWSCAVIFDNDRRRFVVHIIMWFVIYLARPSMVSINISSIVSPYCQVG